MFDEATTADLVESTSARTQIDKMRRRFERPIMFAALAVIPVLIIEITAHSEPWTAIGFAGDVAIWLIFTAELVSMLVVAPNRWEYLRTHPLEVAIVVLTPPLAPGILQSIRLLRVLRVLRLFRLAPTLNSFFSLAGVQYAAFLAFLTLIAGGQAYADAEGKSVLEGCYWALTTMTTVGYGDESPKTVTGKFVAATVMIVGIGFIAIVTGAVANTFIARAGGFEAKTHARLVDVVERLDRLEAMIRDLAGRDDR